jgi:hypothetical protein
LVGILLAIFHGTPRIACLPFAIFVVFWSDGYCVSTVGLNESMIRKYIENQGKEDTGQAKLELQ